MRVCEHVWKPERESGRERVEERESKRERTQVKEIKNDDGKERECVCS